MQLDNTHQQENDHMLSTAPNKTMKLRGAQLKALLQRFKLSVANFNKGEQGMNTVEAIILLFVAAIVLLVFFALIWPLIRDSVMDQLNNLFNQSGQ